MSRYPQYGNVNDPRQHYSDYDTNYGGAHQQSTHLQPTDDAFTAPGNSYPQPSYPSQLDAARGTYAPVSPTHMAGNPTNAYHMPAYSSDGGGWQGGNTYLEKQKADKHRSKIWTIAAIAVLILLVIIGVVVGVVVSKKNSGGSSSSSSSSSSTSTSSDTKDWVQSVNKVVLYNPKDPSQFKKDDRLKKSMYGMAYMSEGSILPDCGITQEAVLEDVMLMSQLTTRVRIYGADCNQSAILLDAIKLTKTDLSVYLGIYINDDDAVYTRQRDELKSVLQTYGADNIAGITVGNEYVLNYLTQKGSSDPTSADGLAAAAFLKTKIDDTRAMVDGLNLGKKIPIGNGDAGSYTNVQILSAVDYFMSNIHPWFGALPVDLSAGWTWQFFQDNNVALAAQTTNNPELMIAEVGWPTQSSDAAHRTNNASEASVADMQIFMDDWLCAANTNGTKYFWFENMDQPWKDVQFGGVEGWWGLFDKNKGLKDVTIPDCAPTA